MVQPVELGPADAGEVLTLRRAAYVTEAQLHHDLFLPPLVETLDDVADELARADTRGVGYRTRAGRLVASVRLRLDLSAGFAAVGRLAVAPDHQRQGLGTRLLEAVESDLPSAITELRLFTGEHSVGNLRLYTRLGYHENARELTTAGYALVHLVKIRS